ncbi:MAG: hypothetical protein B7Z66_15305 [Chromatiales bacterium 21-64-14]|nr:MAG: hypothetical protein B7Z66_15305 [Chromatiales bacterium 21-64-14]
MADDEDADDRTLPDHEGDRDQRIVTRAHRRFKRVQTYEKEARENWLQDYKFANGDAYNHYQWPNEIYVARSGAQRPTLTINKTQVHNRHIINDAKQNKTGIKFRPVGDGATADAATIWEGIARHVENISRAQAVAYGPAIEFQVQAGLGFTRVATDYVGDDSFDQEIYFRGVDDPLGCYLCDYTEKDGSDARAGFIVADKPREEIEAKYPELKGRLAAANAVDGEDASWLRDDKVREALYFEIEEEPDVLLGDRASGTTILRSVITADLLKKWEAEAEQGGESLQRRDVVRKQVRWYKIVGDIIAEEGDWPGLTIPIVPWVGEETVIDKRLDRRGHTRCLLGPQQMLNYSRSAAVEYGALQSKSPYLTPAEAIGDYQTYWASANTTNHAYLPWKHKDDQGNPIPPPVRQDAPQAAPAFLEGSQAAEQDMQLASGQYDAELGAPGNERTGVAINQRQRQSERATYHFVDNQAIAVRRHGQILLEIVPRVYDTKRLVRIVNEAGIESHVMVDPSAPEAHSVGPNGEITFNPNLGRYEVVSDVGPDYATQRQEAFNAIVQILTQAPALIDRIGDLLFKVADFPLADQIAERLKPGLPPAAQQAVAELQKQLQGQNKLLGEAMQALAEERLKVKSGDAEQAVRAFDADTRRLAVVKDMLPLDPADMRAMIHETVRQALQDNLGPIVAHLSAGVGVDTSAAGPPGATGQPPLRQETPPTGDMMQ